MFKFIIADLLQQELRGQSKTPLFIFTQFKSSSCQVNMLCMLINGDINLCPPYYIVSFNLSLITCSFGFQYTMPCLAPRAVVLPPTSTTSYSAIFFARQ